MRQFPLVLVSIAVTFLSWGVYGPVLHKGQYGMGFEDPVTKLVTPSSLRPFICVGIAYFLIAVIVPLVVLWKNGEKGSWSASGIFWSFSAGAAGAIGALGIIFAFKSNGSPVFVMPLVFGLAPVVNTFVTMWMNRTLKEASAIFLAGVIIVAVGAAGVLFFKPEAKHIEVEESEGGPITISVTKMVGATEETKKWTTNNLEQLRTDSELKEAFQLYQKKKRHPNFTQFIAIIVCIAVTALCWGSYGPVLHKGQSKMDGSRLRPFLCVGLAYFAIAVVVPLLLMTGVSEPGGWSFGGTTWSLVAGAAGAVGALGIIMAFNFGGRPIMVMPLVFGGAPVVNTFTSIITEGTASHISSPFYAFLVLVVIGAMIVLLFAPKPGPPPKQAGAKEADAARSNEIKLPDGSKGEGHSVEQESKDDA